MSWQCRASWYRRCWKYSFVASGRERIPSNVDSYGEYDVLRTLLLHLKRWNLCLLKRMIDKQQWSTSFTRAVSVAWTGHVNWCVFCRKERDTSTAPASGTEVSHNSGCSLTRAAGTRFSSMTSGHRPVCCALLYQLISTSASCDRHIWYVYDFTGLYHFF